MTGEKRNGGSADNGTRDLYATYSGNVRVGVTDNNKKKKRRNNTNKHCTSIITVINVN